MSRRSAAEGSDTSPNNAVNEDEIYYEMHFVREEISRKQMFLVSLNNLPLYLARNQWIYISHHIHNTRSFRTRSMHDECFVLIITSRDRREEMILKSILKSPISQRGRPKLVKRVILI